MNRFTSSMLVFSLLLYANSSFANATVFPKELKQAIAITNTSDDFKRFFKGKLKPDEKVTSVDDVFLEQLHKEFLEGLQPALMPKMIALGGAPGSGKTTFRKKNLNLGPKENYHVHDLDEVLIRIPAYKITLKNEGPKFAFESWWLSAHRVVNIMSDYAIENGFNIIYDRTCACASSLGTLRKAKEKGYKITLYGFYIEEKNALHRIKIRAQKENRMVSGNITRVSLRKFSTLWPQYLKVVNEAHLIDGNKLYFKEIFHASNNVETILDKPSYISFLSHAYSSQIGFIDKGVSRE